MPEYVFDQDLQDERERLAGIERLWDPGARAIMERIGIAPGWRCLEVGAGGGSMARWMAERVGPEGSVLATDVYTTFLEQIEHPNVEVREHDILAGEALEPEFDLAYARLVAEHLGPEVAERLADAVKPGGIVLMEDYDCRTNIGHPQRTESERVTEALLAAMTRAGFDPNFGRRLPSVLEAAGLREVHAEGRVCVIRGGTPETAFFHLTLTALREAMVAGDLVSEEDVDNELAMLGDPATTFLSPTLVAGWGRRAD
jgi:SAM-dependent methyltransferase